MLANYTWSHCISDVYDQQPSGNGLTPRATAGHIVVIARSATRMSAIFFTLNMVVNTPKFSNKTLQTLWATGNWRRFFN